MTSWSISLVLISWVFFRSQTLDDSFFILSSIFYFDFSFPVISDISVIVTSFFVLLIGLVFDIILKVRKTHLESFGMYLNNKVYIICSSFIIMLLVLFYSSSDQFIYFQF